MPPAPAVYLHGLAGDLSASEIGDTGLAAMDLARAHPARRFSKVRVRE